MLCRISAVHILKSMQSRSFIGFRRLGKNTYAVHVQPHAQTLLQPKISDDH